MVEQIGDLRPVVLVLSAERVRQPARIVIQLALRLRVSRRLAALVARLRLLIRMSVLVTVDEVLKLVSVAFSLGAQWSLVTHLAMERSLALVPELELVRGADLRRLVSVHSRVHKLRRHRSWAVINLLARQAVVQDGVLDGGHAADLVLQGLLAARLIVIPFAEDVVFVDVTTLFGNTLAAEDVHANDIIFVELLRPALRNAILDLVLDDGLVWALCKRLRQRLLVQLVELIVELSNHLLDVGAFLLGVDLLEHGDLHVLLREEALLH